MKINLTTQLKDFMGESIYQDFTMEQMVWVMNQLIQTAEKEQKGLGDKLEKQAIELMKDKVPMTLRNAIYTCSSSGIKDVSSNEREQMFSIAVACMNKDEAEFKPEQQVLVKKFAGLIWTSSLLVGQVCGLIEGKDPFAVDEPKEKVVDKSPESAAEAKQPTTV